MPKLVKDTTLGTRLRATDFRNLSVAETRYASGDNLLPHEHDFTYLSLVLRGSFEERDSGFASAILLVNRT